MSVKRKRRKYLVDARLQYRLLLQAAFHWTTFVLVTFIALFLWEFLLTGPTASLGEHCAKTWDRYGPALVLLGAMLPVVTYDSLRLSNRIAGPMFRFRGALSRLAAGESVQPIQFRPGDFWHELAEDFNVLAERVQAIQTPPSPQSPDASLNAPADLPAQALSEV